jgi:hypothetical protein
MRAEFFRPDAPDEVVAAADWDGRRVVPEEKDDRARESLRRIFRPSSVAVDEGSMRPPGASGKTVVEPGDLEWFRTAALVRGAQEGLGVRFETTEPGGWDPALDPAAYGWGGRKPALPRER